MIIEKLLLWMFSSGRPTAASQRAAQRAANRDSATTSAPKPSAGTPPRIERSERTFRPPEPVKRPVIQTPDIKTPAVSIPKVTAPKVSVPKVSLPQVSVPKVDTSDIDLPNIGDLKINAPMIEDGWFKRTVRNNRVSIATMIAVVLFMYGGFAWSNRKPRLVRKTTEPQTQQLSDEFDELLDIPVYEGVDPKLQNDEQSVMRQASNHMEVRPSGSVSDYDPFDALSIEDAQTTPFTEQGDEFSEVFTQPDVKEVSPRGVMEEPTLKTPGLAFPDSSELPTLDSGDAAPLLKIGFEGR